MMRIRLLIQLVLQKMITMIMHKEIMKLYLIELLSLIPVWRILSTLFGLLFHPKCVRWIS